jgi:hypothetical protein
MLDSFEGSQEYSEFLFINHCFSFGLKVIQVSINPLEINLITIDDMLALNNVLNQLLLRYQSLFVDIQLTEYVL